MVTITNEQKQRIDNQAIGQIKKTDLYANRGIEMLKSLGFRFTEETRKFSYAVYDEEGGGLTEVVDSASLLNDEDTRYGFQEPEVVGNIVTVKGALYQYNLGVMFNAVPTNDPDLFVTVCSQAIFAHTKSGDVTTGISLDYGDNRINKISSCVSLDNGETLLIGTEYGLAYFIIRAGVVTPLNRKSVDEHKIVRDAEVRSYGASVAVSTTVEVSSFDRVIDYNKNTKAMNKLLAKHMKGIHLTETTLCWDDALVLAQDYDWSHEAKYIKSNRYHGTTELTKGRVLHTFESAVFVCDAEKNALLYIPVYELHGAEFNEKTGMIIVHGHEAIHSFSLDDFSTLKMTYTR